MPEEMNTAVSTYGDKKRGTTIVLAILLGLLGIHRFYLGETKMGLVYFAFCWTGFTFFFALYDAYWYYSNPDEFGGQSASGRAKNVDEGSQPASTQAQDLEKPADAILQVSGVNGTVILYDDRLEISREDIGVVHRMQHGFSGTKEIPLSSITSIQLSKPGSFARGYIQFGQSGYTEDSDGLMDATSDENTVLLEKDSLEEFEKLKEKVRSMSSESVKSSTSEVDDALKKLRERYAAGEIEEEEFEKRKEVLEGG